MDPIDHSLMNESIENIVALVYIRWCLLWNQATIKIFNKPTVVNQVQVLRFSIKLLQ